MAKSFLTEYRFELSSFLSLLFGFLSLVGLVGVINGGKGAFSFLEPLISPFGDWISWISIIAPVALIICLFWLYDYLNKVRKLSKLIDNSSKAKFVKNLDDIEYLAWNLPKRYETRVLDKKRDFKL